MSTQQPVLANVDLRRRPKPHNQSLPFLYAYRTKVDGAGAVPAGDTGGSVV